MKDEYAQKLDDCYNDIISIKSHINANKFDSLNRYLISYSIVAASGTIEYVYKGLITDKISNGASSEAKNYLNKYIKESSSNPSVGNILRVLQDINNTWRTEFDNKTRGTNEKWSLSSLVNMRNDFSHGKTITCSIEDVVKYYQDARTTLNWLEAIINS